MQPNFLPNMRKAVRLCIFLILISCSLPVYGQYEYIDSLRDVWVDESRTDTVRLEAVYEMSAEYLYSMPDSAFHLAQLHYDFAEKVGNKAEMAKALNTQGISFMYRGDYAKAIDYFARCLRIYEAIGNKRGIANSLGNFGIVYAEQGNYEKALEYNTRSLKLIEETGDKTGIARALNNVANIYNALGNYAKAIEHDTRSLKIKEELGDQRGIATSLSNIGVMYQDQGNYAKAMEYHNRSLKIREKIGDEEGIAASYNNMGLIHAAQGSPVKAIDFAEKALALGKQIGAALIIQDAAEILYANYKKTGQHAKALDMHELYITTRDSILSEENQLAVIRQEYQYNYEKQALADSLGYARKEAVHKANLSRQRIALASAAGGLLLLLALAFAIYRGKRKSDHLLLNILPSETAKELKQKGHADARHYAHVTVLFTDFKDFTQLTERLNPDVLVAAIDECFRAFDNIIEQYGIEKIKTIGDSYMAAGGLPAPGKTNATQVVKAALEMRDFILDYKKRKGDDGFEMRIGIHTGPVVAGIVGIKKFQYDIWGDTVNTASRMESSGEPGKVNISGTTYALVKEEFQCTYRGKIEAKNKGQVDMYFVDWLHKNRNTEGQEVVVEELAQIIPPAHLPEV